jgi:hypothetical protein
MTTSQPDSPHVAAPDIEDVCWRLEQFNRYEPKLDMGDDVRRLKHAARCYGRNATTSIVRGLMRRLQNSIDGYDGTLAGDIEIRSGIARLEAAVCGGRVKEIFTTSQRSRKQASRFWHTYRN